MIWCTHRRLSHLLPPHLSSLHYPKWTVQGALALSAQCCSSLGGRENVQGSLGNDERKCLVMTTVCLYCSLAWSPKCFQKPYGTFTAPLQKRFLKKWKNWAKITSVCKACINSVSQWRSKHSFSLWWCASLLLISEAQPAGWDVSICAQVECCVPMLSFVLPILPEKQSKRHEEGCTLENCIPFCFSQLLCFFSLQEMFLLS